MFILAFGVVFELPLIMMLLSWAGIVDHIKMRKVRKYAILVRPSSPWSSLPARTR